VDLGTAFVDNVLGADAVDPGRALQQGVAKGPVSCGCTQQDISTQRQGERTEYIDVLLSNTFTYWVRRKLLLTLFVRGNSDF
jgi:hypothetical protein